MTTTFETAKVGDRVWSLGMGWGEIRDTSHSARYPIHVCFQNGDYETYTLGGFYDDKDKTQYLFWDEIVIEAPVKPMPVLQVDAKVLVWDVPEIKHKRHFSHFDAHGYIYTFTDGKTSFTSRSTEVSKWLDWDFAE